MLANKWMVFCLLIGSILAVGMVSSIPLYTEGVLNRMLRRDLEQYQRDYSYYPGRYQLKINLESIYAASDRVDAYSFFAYHVPLKVHQEMGIPTVSETRTAISSALRARVPVTPDNKEGVSVVRMANVPGSMDHVAIKRGRLPEDGVKMENGKRVIEAVVPDGVVVKRGFTVGEEYEFYDAQERTADFVVRIVGQFGMKEAGDHFWYDGLALVEDAFLVGDQAYADICLENRVSPLIGTVEWYFGLDYTKISIENLSHVITTMHEHQKWVEGYRAGQLRIVAIPTLEKYDARETQLRTMLMVLQVPILLMLVFYIFMVAQLIVDYEKNEISVIKSRGASRGQVVGIYLLENLLIGAVALVAGPLLGWFVCSVLGASNGFLEFVSRAALPVQLNMNTVRYAFVTVITIVLMMLAPAVVQARRTIVEHKQQSARQRPALWKRFFLDVLLILLSFYGLYSYRMRQQTMTIASDVAGTNVPIDPLLFLISTLFVLGVGLFVLRLYPYLLRGVFALGKRLWPPSMYASFITVGRSRGQEQFLMIFLILTLSVGIFNANAARTINRNVEEKLLYDTGADMAVVPVWRSNQVFVDPEAPAPTTGAAVVSTDAGFGDDRIVTYIEPPFEPWQQLPGVAAATKVYVNDKVSLTIPGQSGGASRLMGVESADFGRVAFMPDGLMKPHWYAYLNAITHESKACLVSRAFATQYKLAPGDTFTVSWARQSPLELRIYGFFDYWPTFNPYNTQMGDKMIVCNLAYIQAKMAVEPYQTWIKRAPGATSQDIYTAIEEQKLLVEKVTDARQNLVRLKNDPMLQGANGAMTMGFIVTMIVSGIGFIIYWILSLKGRVLQFGIFRAMGLSLRSLIGMLLWEQLLICGTSILVGIITGGVAAQMFVPMLQIVYSASQQVPPFHVVASGADYVKIYAFIAVMLIAGFIVLGTLLSRIKVAQALKLGED